jgi:hypothetical protein
VTRPLFHKKQGEIGAINFRADFALVPPKKRLVIVAVTENLAH